MKNQFCPAVSSSNPAACIHLFSASILARATNLHPVAAVLVGLNWGGPVGDVIAVPLAVLTKFLVLNCWLPGSMRGLNTEVRP